MIYNSWGEKHALLTFGRKYTLSKLGVCWVSDNEPEAPKEVSQFPKQAPQSPDYVPRPEHPPSPNYVPGPEYLEYLVPSDDEVPIEDQPLPANASPTFLSPGYVADFDPSDEDPKEDPAEYPANGGDDDDDDDGDDNDNDEEDEEEEEHLAPADSTTLPVVDLVPLAEDTEAFETDESAPTPPVSSPRLRYKAAMIQSRAASPLPLPAPLSPLLLPATDRREDVPEADVPPWKRLCLTAPALRFEVGGSSAVAIARQPRLDYTHATDYSFVDTVDATPKCPMSREVGYGITDVWDDMVGDIEGRVLTTLENEARHARQAWSQAMDYNRMVHAELLAYRTEVKALHEQINVLQRQRTKDNDRLTRYIQQGHDRTKEPKPARDPEPAKFYG
ncbi:hypothetical protein Tco_0425477 [Tanacetum coccineum]